MRKSNKMVALGLALTLAVSALTGCGGNKQTSSSTSKSGSTANTSTQSGSQASTGSTGAKTSGSQV
ncbi:MAG: hypothetical protein HXK79_09575, partial [Lachnospiraceae bacterium]|nr:hypothetical protein [Lachnospiraceae bacterium]